MSHLHLSKHFYLKALHVWWCDGVEGGRHMVMGRKGLRAGGKSTQTSSPANPHRHSPPFRPTQPQSRGNNTYTFSQISDYIEQYAPRLIISPPTCRVDSSRAELTCKGWCIIVHQSNIIIKYADDTTMFGLISDGDETAYRAEVENLSCWCSKK